MREKYTLLFMIKVFTLFFLVSVVYIGPAYAMKELDDAEMSRIWAGNYLVFVRVEPEPRTITDPPGQRPAYDMNRLVGPSYTLGEKNKGLFHGSDTWSPQVTLKDLNGNLWVMEKAVYGQMPISLRLVINTFSIPRIYFGDMGLERYGWELVDADFSRLVRIMFNDMNLLGVDDKPLTVDTVVHQISYNPIPKHEWVAVREETYYPDGSVHGLKSVFRGEECHYRRGYWVVLTY